MSLLAATDARFANFATIAFSTGSRMSEIAFSGSNPLNHALPVFGPGRALPSGPAAGKS